MKGIKGQVIQASMREAPATPAKPVARAAQPAKASAPAAGFWSRAPRPEMMPGGGRGAAAVQAKPAPRSGGASVQLSPVALAPAALREGAGLPLPSDVRRRMEGLLGADLSAVRVHQGPQADAIGARAFTAGNDVYFGRQEYRPSTKEGQALLAKQLTYVVQQRAGLVRNPGGGSGVVLVRDAGLEAQANQIAALATRPGAVQAKRLPSGKGMFQVKTSRKGPGQQHLELYEGGRAVGGADVLLEKGQARLYNCCLLYTSRCV